jgi:hypothetical protein
MAANTEELVMASLDSPSVGATTINLLWTGGWDSTFRLLQILQDGEGVVQPWYVIREKRRSVGMEIRTMHVIRKRIAARNALWSDRIAASRYVGAEEDQTDVEAIERMRGRGHLGMQYAWLNRVAVSLGLNDLELSIHRDDRAHEFVAPMVVPIREGSTIYKLSSEVTDPDLRLFQPFHLPILDWTKLSMQEYAVQHGLLELMDMTWFCHSPHGDRPCGRCNPCRYTAAEGLARRIPRTAALYGAAGRLKKNVKAWFFG